MVNYFLSSNRCWFPTRQSCDSWKKLVGFLPFTFGCNCLCPFVNRKLFLYLTEIKRSKTQKKSLPKFRDSPDCSGILLCLTDIKDRTESRKTAAKNAQAIRSNLLSLQLEKD